MPSGAGLALLGEAEAPPRKLSGSHSFPGGPLSSGPLVILVRLGVGDGGGHEKVRTSGLCLSCHGHRPPTPTSFQHPLLKAEGRPCLRGWRAWIRGAIEEACQSWGRQGQKMWGGGGGEVTRRLESLQANCGEWATGGWSQLFGLGGEPSQGAQVGACGQLGAMWRGFRCCVWGISTSEQACSPTVPYESHLLVRAADQPAG